MSESQLDVSVIVPCHNVADTLPEQLDALAEQRWQGSWDVVIVDNNSTDATVQVARSSRLRNRLRVVSATEGQSVAYARNAGVAASSARSVIFCDGDDVVRPGWLAAMGDALSAEPLVSGGVDPSRINAAWLAETRPSGSASSLPSFGPHPFARGNNTGMWRSVWEQVGGYDEQFRGLEDIEFSLRAAAHGITPSYVDGATIDYRYRPGLGALWRQGFFYGRGRRELARRARALGLSAPSPIGGVKSWAWLVVHVPRLRTRTGRWAWVWVAANRLGSLAGLLSRPQPFDADRTSTLPAPSSSRAPQ